MKCKLTLLGSALLGNAAFAATTFTTPFDTATYGGSTSLAGGVAVRAGRTVQVLP